MYNKQKKKNESRAVLTSPNFADANALEIESWAEGRKQVDTIVVMMENTTTSGVCVVDSSRQSPSNGNDGVGGIWSQRSCSRSFFEPKEGSGRLRWCCSGARSRSSMQWRSHLKRRPRAGRRAAPCRHPRPRPGAAALQVPAAAGGAERAGSAGGRRGRLSRARAVKGGAGQDGDGRRRLESVLGGWRLRLVYAGWKRKTTSVALGRTRPTLAQSPPISAWPTPESSARLRVPPRLH